MAASIVLKIYFASKQLLQLSFTKDCAFLDTVRYLDITKILVPRLNFESPVSTFFEMKIVVAKPTVI